MQQMQQAFWSQLANIATGKRIEVTMSQREKPTDPKSVLRGPCVLLHQPPPGRISAGLLRRPGSEALRDYMKGRAKQLGIDNVPNQQCRLPRPLRARADFGDLSKASGTPCPTKEDIDEVLRST